MVWSGVGQKKSDTKRTGPNKLVELRPPGSQHNVDVAGEDKPKSEPAKEKDLAGGMEMLELDFLLGVIEATKGADKNDVAMRKLSFNELLRRQQQNQVASNALTVYAVDESNLYGKDIQCEAMKELTKRTAQQK